MNYNWSDIIGKYFKGRVLYYVPFERGIVVNRIHKPTKIIFLLVDDNKSTIRVPGMHVQVVPNNQLSFDERDLMRIILQLRTK